MILHRDEAGHPCFSATCSAFWNCHTNMADAPTYRALPALTTSCSASIVSSIGVLIIPAMDLVEVHVVRPKALQAFRDTSIPVFPSFAYSNAFFLSNDRVGPGTDDQALVPARVFPLVFSSRCNL